MDVSLEDILDMRHISPLSLKDLEQYRLFEEYGAENLYFVPRVKYYTVRFAADTSPAQLSLSIARAKATFFAVNSQYELNLPASRVSEFFAACSSASYQGSRSPSTYSTTSQLSSTFTSLATAPFAPHPPSFASIYNEVEHMLRISAHRFVRARTRNVSFQRAYCVLFGGLQTMALALAPLLLSIFRHQSRWIRFSMIPPLWMGLTVTICALNGICIMIVSGYMRPQTSLFTSLISISSADPANYIPSSLTAPQFPFHLTLPVHTPLLQPKPYRPSNHPPNVCILQLQVQPASLPPVYVKHLQRRKTDHTPLPEIRPSSPLSGHFNFGTAEFIPRQDADVISIGTRTDAEAAIGGSTTEVPRLPQI
ncbi:hypothetical protein FRC07_001209 [Ceratobasidium sp. 392]|nr:hypothetical protein FRC07_001209 [Ceratobasidium sp. 392]